MSSRAPYAFRINLEQQKTRAKELLRAARAGDPQALERLRIHRRSVSSRPAASWKLADAQHAIARELRFPSWPRLKVHADALQRQRLAIESAGAAPDGGQATLHIRCGTDIREALREGGFVGDFLEHSTPYSTGPVLAGPEGHERMARFLVAAYPDARGGLVYETVLADLLEGEQALKRSGAAYERIVLWMEHDPWDQLILARLLAHYAGGPRPPVLELVTIGDFPGSERFIGMGQLPAEALRWLWDRRKAVSARQLQLGEHVWAALCSDNPQRLAALARSGTPALPLMAPALHRHLQELPWVEDGLALSQRLILQLLAPGRTPLNAVFLQLKERDPLPSITDLHLLYLVNEMLKAEEAPLIRNPPPPGRRLFAQMLELTEAGTAVLHKERDWHSLHPPSRWVGGVQVSAVPGWRWHDARREVVWRG